MAKKSERKEAWMRIIVGIISGIILEVWEALIIVLGIIHWLVVVFSGRRDKALADFCEYWNSERYRYYRYMTFVTNERPFPFTNLKKLGKFEK